MKLHRFYIDPDILALERTVWVNDSGLLNQWQKVLRYKTDDQLILFDGVEHDRLYKITQLEPGAIKLELVTEFSRKLPDKHIYLFFSLLKKDKNEWLLQKCTELGVRNFTPIIADRSEKTGFNMERAKKIVTEAAEQCGRSDIPQIREPLSVETALQEHKDKINILVGDERLEDSSQNFVEPAGILIGPEGGWTEGEYKLFDDFGLGHLNLGKLTLRAETACVAAVAKLIQ